MSENMYELMFIMDVALAEDERREILNEIEREVIDLGAKVETTEQYDVRDLAYPINDITRGDYRLVRYRADGQMNQDLQERLNIRDDVLRYMLIKLDERDRRIFEESDTEDAGESEEAAEETADTA